MLSYHDTLPNLSIIDGGNIIVRHCHFTPDGGDVDR